jgi:hypothetical protein
MPRAFDRTCPRCGWDNQVKVRKCLHCKAMISLNETLTYRSILGSGLVIGLISWYFLGPFLGGANGVAVGSLFALITLAGLRYRCGGCGKRPEARLLTPKEKHSVWIRRLGYFAVALVFGGIAVRLYLKASGRTA